MHKDLKFAGLLNPLDCPHHARKGEFMRFREGVVLDKVPPGKAGGSLVSCGLYRDVHISQSIVAGVRVTVEFLESEDAWHSVERGEKGFPKAHKGQAVSPSVASTSLGVFWGFTVRMADGLIEALTTGPYKGGYDLTIGVCDGRADGVAPAPVASIPTDPVKHVLVVLGGSDGLQEGFLAEQADKESSAALACDHVSQLFDCWVDAAPHRGARSLRAEETALVALTAIGLQLSTMHE
jgi:methyltransferase